MAALLGGGSAFRRAVWRDGVRFRVALVIVVVAAVTGVTAGILIALRSSGPPARARHYLAFTACMLTDARGLSGDQAGEVWAGLEQASLTIHAQVEYLPVTTGSTEAAAAPFLASLVERQCKVVIAVGRAQVAAVAAEAGRFSRVRFGVLGGTATGPNVMRLAGSAGAVRSAVASLVTTAVGSGPG
jgi:basic membrane lipoprotein Med (substrate-binding protein (PBP1-ABC) superfamily)